MKQSGKQQRTIAIVGAGLIGGSMAKDLRRKGFASRFIGVSRKPETSARALELGLIDDALPLDEAMAVSDIIILAIPVNAIQKMLPEVLDKMSSAAVVLDAGSTKGLICEAVRNHPMRSRFVASHPIAGTENSGPEAAIEGLFRGKVNIICERELSAPDAMETVTALFDALEMKTLFMDPTEHDKHVAYVSHLSHVSSFLLGQTVLDIEKDQKNIFNLAGSGFASTVRLAKSSPDMWAPIFAQNKKYLNQALKEYIRHLQIFQQHLEAGDMEKLHQIMLEANSIRRVLQGIEQSGQRVQAQAVEEQK